MRQVRSSLLDVLGPGLHPDGARQGAGASDAVIVGHALKNALIPVVTLIGLQVGAIIEGAIITETIFFWPGIGRLAVDSIGGRDYPVVQAIVLFSALSFMLTTLAGRPAVRLARPAHLATGAERERELRQDRRCARPLAARASGAATAGLAAVLRTPAARADRRRLLVLLLIVWRCWRRCSRRYDPIDGQPVAMALEPPEPGVTCSAPTTSAATC